MKFLGFFLLFVNFSMSMEFPESSSDGSSFTLKKRASFLNLSVTDLPLMPIDLKNEHRDKNASSLENMAFDITCIFVSYLNVRDCIRLSNVSRRLRKQTTFYRLWFISPSQYMGVMGALHLLSQLDRDDSNKPHELLRILNPNSPLVAVRNKYMAACLAAVDRISFSPTFRLCNGPTRYQKLLRNKDIHSSLPASNDKFFFKTASDLFKKLTISFMRDPVLGSVLTVSVIGGVAYCCYNAWVFNNDIYPEQLSNALNFTKSDEFINSPAYTKLFCPRAANAGENCTRSDIWQATSSCISFKGYFDSLYFFPHGCLPYDFEEDWCGESQEFYQTLKHNWNRFCIYREPKIFRDNRLISNSDYRQIIMTEFRKGREPYEFMLNNLYLLKFDPICAAKNMISLTTYYTQIVSLVIMSIFYIISFIFGWLL